MRTSGYAPLVNYLRGLSGDRVLLSFEQIEAILDVALPRSARVRYGFWRDPARRHVADLERAGWQATLHTSAQAVEFRRIDTEA